METKDGGKGFHMFWIQARYEAAYYLDTISALKRCQAIEVPFCASRS